MQMQLSSEANCYVPFASAIPLQHQNEWKVIKNETCTCTNKLISKCQEFLPPSFHLTFSWYFRCNWDKLCILEEINVRLKREEKRHENKFEYIPKKTIYSRPE